MRRPRSETFFVPLGAPFVDLYLPKQSAKEIRPVVQINTYLARTNLAAEPYFLQPITGGLQYIFLTFRATDTSELLVDQPAWQFGGSVQFSAATPYVPIMTNPRTFAALPIDPQKSSVRLTQSIPNEVLAVEFVYAV